MDKIQKFLNKLTKDERTRVLEVLNFLIAGDVQGLDIKRLTTRSRLYRVRTGDIRIIFSIDKSGVSVIAIERRGKDTYKRFK